MTILEAFKSGIEFAYSNDNLFTRILTDRGLTGSTAYTASYAQDVDLAIADLYGYLVVHPDYSEGKQSQTWDRGKLLYARRMLYAKHGQIPPEIANKTSSISGARLW